MRMATEMDLRSPEHFDVASTLAEEFIHKLTLLTAIPLTVVGKSNSPQGVQVVIHDPPRVKSKGRPKKLGRIKFGIEVSMSQAKKKRVPKTKNNTKDHHTITGSSSQINQTCIEEISGVQGSFQCSGSQCSRGTYRREYESLHRFFWRIS